jgi:hypothetical protein
MSELRPQGHVPANRFNLYVQMPGFNSQLKNRWNQVVIQLRFVQHRNRTKTFSGTSPLLFHNCLKET